MTSNEEGITISKEVYNELLNDSILLKCLRNGGVENWEWFGEALEQYLTIMEQDND